MGESEATVVTSRKRKKNSEVESSEAVPEKKAKNFCCRTFRQELRGSEALKSLKRFIAAAKNSDDVIFEYLEGGGSLQEILSLIDATATGDLTTALPVFEVVHLILLRFQSSSSKHHQRCIDSARTILRSHMFTIKAMLSMNITKQKKVALKVLTAIATLDSSFANEIMNIVALSPTLITDLIHLSSEKESVRKCFILFVLSFLIEGNLIVVKNLLDKKGFVGSIIPGLKFDEAVTVNLTLSLFEEKILKNVKIPKTLKLKLFNTQIIKSLFDLYDWKGLQGIKQIVPTKKNKVKEIEISQSEKEMVVESVHSFLLLLCCSQKYGVAFNSKSVGATEQLNNQLLLTVFESLADPLKNKKVAEVILKTTVSCPDILKPLLAKLEPSFQPRNSKNWFQAMEFAENLLKEMNVAAVIKSQGDTLSAGQIVKMGKTLCAPVVFLRVAKLGFQVSQEMEIRFRSLRLLTVIWEGIQGLLADFQNFVEDFKKSLYKHIFKCLPDAVDLVDLWHGLCNVDFFGSLSLTQEKKISFLSAVLECLHMIVECQRDAVSSPLSLTSDLLNRLDVLRGCMTEREFDDLQVKIVRVVETDLGGLTPETELFEKCLRILFRSTEDSSITYLSKILGSLEAFERNRGEVDVWLLSYLEAPQEYRPSISDFLIESIRISHVGPTEVDLPGDANSSSDGIDRDKTREALTPVIFKCVEVLKSTSKSGRKDPEQAAVRHYLNDVIIHLQLFYTVDVYLYDLLKDFRKMLNKSTMDFLKKWKISGLDAADLEVFSSPSERGLISWLRNDSNGSRAVREVIAADEGNLLKLHSLFRTTLAFLTGKTVRGDLREREAGKSAEALSFLLSAGGPHGEEEEEEEEREGVESVSGAVENGAAYRRRCLGALFGSGHLLKAFDVFSQKKDTSNARATDVLFKVLIEGGGDTARRLELKRKLSTAWKSKFSKQLKARLKKNKSVDGLEKLEKVFEFFEFDHSDVKEMVELLTAVSELNLFWNENNPSGWCVILSKFIRIHCEKEELSEGIVKKLCLIVKYLNEKPASNLELLIECFVYLLRKHPCHLPMVGDDFLAVVLSRDPTPSFSILGKLLLNDPNKVRYFFEFVEEDSEGLGNLRVVFDLLSALVVAEGSFLDGLELEGARSFWKISEIAPETAPDLFKVLELVYRKCEKTIFRALTRGGSEVFSGGSRVARELVKLFLEDKKLEKVKKEISKGGFDPELAFEAVKKLGDPAVTEGFVQGLLSLFCRSLVRPEEDVDWTKFCSIVVDVIALDKEMSWENVERSSEWKEFPRLSLGFCLTSTKHSSLIKILRLFLTAFYKTENDDCGLIFQMLISHSQFLKTMLGGAPVKSELVELFRCLIERCPSEMSPKHFPTLLASYTASLSECDRTLLQILNFYEGKGVGVSEYEPFVWGDTAVSHYSIGTSSGLSLWQRFNMGNVLDLLDGQRLELSLREFPVTRRLGGVRHVTTDFDSNVYDPAFLLPLFTNLLSPGALVFCLTFIHKGGLAYTVRALSSECKEVRLMASTVLTRFYNHLELSQNLKQKLVWMHFINCFRYGIEDLSERPLPNISTLFLARMTLELSRQPAELYVPLQNFLLAKFYFSFEAVPEFLPLFHSAEVSHRKHREWLLEVMRDGMKTTADINIVFHSMAPKVIFCYFCSQLCDIETKKLILQVVERMLRIDKSVLLISEYGLLNWITSVDSSSFQSILHDLLNLLSTLTGVITKDIRFHKRKHSNPFHLIQILNMAVRLLPSLKCVKSVEDFKIYLKIIVDCFVVFNKNGDTHWFRLNKNWLSDIVEAGVVILGDEYDCDKFRKVPFYFRDFNGESCCEDLKNCVFLFDLLINKQGNKRE